MAETIEETQPHPGRARRGTAASEGASFDPDAPPPLAAAMAETRRQRPATTRFPIPHEEFMALKDAAYRQPRALPRAAATLAQDSSRQTQELATAPGAPAALAAPPLAPPAAAPTAAGNFAGIAHTGWIPPDCTLAAGPEHVLVSVNSSVAIYGKTGGAALLQRTLTTWFANVVSGAQIFDPKALYDQHAGRWVLVAVALDGTANRSWFLLSVSKTINPLGGWWNYALDATKDGTTATNNWADYPSVGVDNQALYLTANMFQFNGGFQYAKIRIVPKAGPYAGGAVTFRDFVNMQNANGVTAFTLQPCHTFNAPQVQYLVNSYYPTNAAPTQTRLTLWSLTNPLATSPTLTRRTVTVAPYGLPPDAGQQGGGTALDTGDVRMLNAVFRGGSVWTALTTQHNWGDGVSVAAAHWFQINATSGALIQQGVYGARQLHFYYPAVMPDTNGNMTMVFARSGAAEFASIRYTGRRSTDPLGQLQSSALLRAGVANYTGLDGFGRNRWGDYNGIASDPADGRTVWVYSEFANAGNTWGTWIGATRF